MTMPRPSHYKPKPLSREQQRFILWLIHQPQYSKKVDTQRTLARELGVHPVTLSKWKQLPAFKVELAAQKRLQNQARNAAINEANIVRELLRWRVYQGMDTGRNYYRPAPPRPAPRKKKRLRRYQVWPANVRRTAPPSKVNPHAGEPASPFPSGLRLWQTWARLVKYERKSGSKEAAVSREVNRQMRRKREYQRAVARAEAENN
jgi:hypothetical protein